MSDAEKKDGTATEAEPGQAQAEAAPKQEPYDPAAGAAALAAFEAEQSGGAEAKAKAEAQAQAQAKAKAEAEAKAEAAAKAKAKAEAEPSEEEKAAAAEKKRRARDSARMVAIDPKEIDELDPDHKAQTPVVEFINVSKTYGEGASAFTAITDINFKVHDRPDHGEFVAILGPSGCGKSTVLRLIAGLSPQHPPTTGKVLVDGEEVNGPGPQRGMVFQDYTSFDHRTVQDNVAFGLECRGVSKKERMQQAWDWIAKVGLSVKHDRKKYPHELSGGMRQRVAIARTLALHPRIILMDEPFGALDPSTRMRMQDLLVGLWRELEATVFFVTHSIEEAVYLGDRIYILSSSPGTILREVEVPPPDIPAKDMQKKPEFMEYVFDIRDTIEQLESSQRAGDD
jgi:NitT/TauT family transport system ATP-binding protein